MADKGNLAFNFGRNWQAFSDRSLGEQGLDAAVESLDQLIGKDRIVGRTLLDIGCGSGLFSIAAVNAHAKHVVGIDISRESVETSIRNKQRFAPQGDVAFYHQSIFEPEVRDLGRFDIVYSWGVLHHTGSMVKAIDIAAGLVADRGLLVIAIYNRHWSSGLWKAVKWLYNRMPGPIRRLMIGFFYGVIALAKWVVTRRNPFKKRRGMSFYYDVVDWVGGYPYEYASPPEIINHVLGKGFVCLKVVRPSAPTGCNEFVFEKGQGLSADHG